MKNRRASCVKRQASKKKTKTEVPLLLRLTHDSRCSTHDGFSLIETIVTIVVIAIVAVMMLSYFGTGIIHSSDPIFRLETSVNLNQTMERIKSYYNNPPHWQPNTYYAQNSPVIPLQIQNLTGLQYYAQTAGWSSSSVEPTWPTSTSATFTEVPTGHSPGVTWALTPSICAPSVSSQSMDTVCTTCRSHPSTSNYSCSNNLQTQIGSEGGTGNTAFGNYYVVENRLIYFVNGTEQCCDPVCGTSTCPGQGLYLKVTIQPTSQASQTLSALFVRR